MKHLLSILTIMTLLILPAKARDIRGRVIAEQDTTPIASAKCILTADGRQVSETTTDPSGSFSISTPLKGNLILTIDKDDYNPTDVIVESGAKEVDLGIVWLSSGTMLDELQVEGSVTFDAKGRTIVYPSQADVKASPNSLSLFSKLPLAGLTTDPVFRTISVLGDQPTILIDGVPSTQQDLLQLRPGNIEKIEYSILPPARYANGNGKGFISITLKKRNDGGQVDIWARGALNTVMDDASISASYHQGPSNFTLSVSPSWRNYHKVFDYTEESFIGDDGYRLDQVTSDSNPFNYFTLPASLRYTFAPNAATVFTATLNMNLHKSHRSTYGETEDFLDNDYDFSKVQHDRDLTTSLDLYFRRDFNPANSLEAQMVGTLADNRYDRDNDYLYHSGSEESYFVDVKSKRRSLITALSYVHNFADYTSLTAGVRNTLSHSRNHYFESDYRPVLTENNNYIYVSASHLLNKVYMTARTGALINCLRNDGSSHTYANNTSTLQMQWTPRQIFSLTFYTNYASNFPNISQLTDYAQQLTPYLISNGNPDLKGSHFLSFYVGPTFRHGKLSVNGSVRYDRGFNPVYGAFSYLGDGLFLSRTENYRYYSNWTGALQVSMSGLKGFGFNVGLQYSHSVSVGHDWRTSLASWSGSVNVWYNNGPFTISYYRKFPGKYLYAQNIGKEENSDALTFTYSPNKHWDLGLSWMYMFDGHGTKYPQQRISAIAPMVIDRYIRDNGNMVMLTVNYKTDFGSIFRTRQRTLQNSDSGNAILKL